MKIFSLSILSLIVLAVLSLSASAVADGLSGPGEQAADALRGINPIILIAAGVLLLLATHLAKLIAILLIVVGVAGLILSLI